MTLSTALSPSVPVRPTDHSSLSHPPALPHELHELIIDSLASSSSSFPALKLCSLVCRAWLPRCRAHLYRVIRLCPRRVRGVDRKGMTALFNEMQESFAHTFLSKDVTRYVRGISFEPRVREILKPEAGVEKATEIDDASGLNETHSLGGQTQAGPLLHPNPNPIRNAIIVPSISMSYLPFNQLRYLRVHWKLIDSFISKSQGPSEEARVHDRDVDSEHKIFETILGHIDSLEHLALENVVHFHSARNVLLTLARHAPKLKTLCLSQWKWYPSFSDPQVIEDILDEWDARFRASGVPPLKLEKLSLREFSTKGTDLIKVVVLPSSCLDLSGLKYLGIGAGDLKRVLDDEDRRFVGIGSEVTHLVLQDLDSSALQIRADVFPKLQHLQLYVTDEWVFLHFLQCMMTSSNVNAESGPVFEFEPSLPLPRLTNLHLNIDNIPWDIVSGSSSRFRAKARGRGRGPVNPYHDGGLAADREFSKPKLAEHSREYPNDGEEDDVFIAECSADSALCSLIGMMRYHADMEAEASGTGTAGAPSVTIDFQGASSEREMQERYIKKAFPRSYATGRLRWKDSKEMEWFEC